MHTRHSLRWRVKASGRSGVPLSCVPLSASVVHTLQTDRIIIVRDSQLWAMCEQLFKCARSLGGAVKYFSKLLLPNEFWLGVN